MRLTVLSDMPQVVPFHSCCAPTMIDEVEIKINIASFFAIFMLSVVVSCVLNSGAVRQPRSLGRISRYCCNPKFPFSASPRFMIASCVNFIHRVFSLFRPLCKIVYDKCRSRFDTCAALRLQFFCVIGERKLARCIEAEVYFVSPIFFMLFTHRSMRIRGKLRL